MAVLRKPTSSKEKRGEGEKRKRKRKKRKSKRKGLSNESPPYSFLRGKPGTDLPSNLRETLKKGGQTYEIIVSKTSDIRQ